MMLALQVGARLVARRSVFLVSGSKFGIAGLSSQKSPASASHVSEAAKASWRAFSSSESGAGRSIGAGSRSFRPRRPSTKTIPSLKMTATKKKKRDPMRGNNSRLVTLGSVPNARDELEAAFGPLAADVIRDVQRRRQENLTANEELEEALRIVDYFNSPDGSTEDLVGQRRAMALQGLTNPTARNEFMAEVDDAIKEGQLLNMDLLDFEKEDKVAEDDLSDLFNEEDDGNMEDRDPDTTLDRNQLAHGDWSEMLVTVDRTTKLWRGGRLESYRALVVGGNMNGCGGFGIGKSLDPLVAVDIAGRRSKRNIFFVDRYQGNGLTRDLVGKQNSCVVTIRATDNGLRGNELCAEILARFGITNCVSKSHGNRNPFNVVRATFKALLTHESLEDISLKRGKRIVSLDRAMRMQV
jgi:small subunit ribosomal protein S5